VGACSGSAGQSGQSVRGGAIEGRPWHVTAYVDAGGKMQDAFVTVPLDARFESGTVSGAAGCDSFTASYALSGGNLTVTGLQVGTYECDSYANEGRARYMAALPRAASFAVAGTKLTVYDAGGHEILRFEERP
jgi:heat shock protein HslJ